MTGPDQTSTQDAFDSWAILELMGHRRLAGHVTEEQIAGALYLRIDIPAIGDEPAATQFYGPQAVYAITPCTEQTARKATAIGRVAPVHHWEIAAKPDRHEYLDQPHDDAF
jgi:hypothetical protein